MICEEWLREQPEPNPRCCVTGCPNKARRFNAWFGPFCDPHDRRFSTTWTFCCSDDSVECRRWADTGPGNPSRNGPRGSRCSQHGGKDFSLATGAAPLSRETAPEPPTSPGEAPFSCEGECGRAASRNARYCDQCFENLLLSSPCAARGCTAPRVTTEEWGTALCRPHLILAREEAPEQHILRWLASCSSVPVIPTEPYFCESHSCPNVAAQGGKFCFSHGRFRAPPSTCEVRGCTSYASDGLCDRHMTQWNASDECAVGADTGYWEWLAAHEQTEDENRGDRRAPLLCAEGCGNPAEPGSRFCRRLDSNWRCQCAGLCLVRSCEQPCGNDEAFCEDHDREYMASSESSLWNFLAAQSPSTHRRATEGDVRPLVAPPEIPGLGNRISVHGAPPDVNSQAMAKALLDPRESLEPPQRLPALCVWHECPRSRRPGALFCEAHQREGESALLAEQTRVEGEIREEERTRPKPCVAGGCPEKREPGHALCGKHVRTLRIELREGGLR